MKRPTKQYLYDFGIYRGWLRESGIPALPGTIDKRHLIAYIAWQQRRPKRKGSGTLSSHSVHHYTRVVRTFVRWLVTEGYYPSDPLAGGKRGPMPKMGPRVLKVAKRGDVEILLAGCEAGEPRSRIERVTRSRDRRGRGTLAPWVRHR